MGDFWLKMKREMGLKVLQSSRERKTLELECDNRAHGNEVPKTRFDCGSLSNNVALAVATGWDEQGDGRWLCPACARRKRKPKVA
jgi:hypothetical protein